MTEYVLIYVRPSMTTNDSVLLIVKNKQNWMFGKLNLVGGKVEPGEQPIAAASRELLEETGLVPDFSPVCCGQIVGNDYIIHCFTADVIYCGLPTICPGADETEEVKWYQWWQVKNDKRLLPNLKLIIPLLAHDVRGWTISEQSAQDAEEKEFKMSVTICR